MLWPLKHAVPPRSQTAFQQPNVDTFTVPKATIAGYQLYLRSVKYGTITSLAVAS